MIKFIKLEKKHSFLHMAGLKQRSEYLKVINDSAKSLSLDFKFLDYMIIISGWDLICLGMLNLYFMLALINLATGNSIAGLAASIDSILLSVLIAVILIGYAYKITKSVIKSAFNM